MDAGQVARKSVPVSKSLLEDLASHPDSYGLEAEGSEAARLRILLEKGAAAAREEAAMQAMTAAYSGWAADSERQHAVEELATHVLAEGGLVDQVIGH